MNELKTQNNEATVNMINTYAPKPISPIVFLPGEKNKKDFRDLITESINKSSYLNYDTMANGIVLNEFSHDDKMALRSLNINNEDIARVQTIEYIKSNSLFLFYSVIENSPLKEVLQYTNIKELVTEILRCPEKYNITATIDQMVDTYFFSKYSFANQFVCDYPGIPNMEAAKGFASEVSLQISSLIYTILCCASNIAIDDVYMKVHLIPNIEKLYELTFNMIKNEPENIRCNYTADNKNNIPALCSLYIKDKLVTLITSIMPKISEVVENSIWHLRESLYFIYDSVSKVYQLEEMEEKDPKLKEEHMKKINERINSLKDDNKNQTTFYYF